MFDHTSSCVCVPEGQAAEAHHRLQAALAARTNRLQVAFWAIQIMDAVQLAAASVSSTLQNFLPDRPYGNYILL